MRESTLRLHHCYAQQVYLHCWQSAMQPGESRRRRQRLVETRMSEEEVLITTTGNRQDPKFARKTLDGTTRIKIRYGNWRLIANSNRDFNHTLFVSRSVLDSRGASRLLPAIPHFPGSELRSPTVELIDRSINSFVPPLGAKVAGAVQPNNGSNPGRACRCRAKGKQSTTVTKFRRTLASIPLAGRQRNGGHPSFLLLTEP